MRRPSQSRPACGNRDASPLFAGAPDTTADDGRAAAARAASAGSDAPRRGHSAGAPSHCKISSSTAGPDRTTSRCRPPSGTDRTRSDGNRDGEARTRPPVGLDLATPEAGYSMSWGHNPRPSGGGRVSPQRDRPRRVSHSPSTTTARVPSRATMMLSSLIPQTAVRKPELRLSQ
jgi:hypothetical protein